MGVNMAARNIVKIDENKCNGCGLCVNACAEGAIQLINGKAKLVSETYCDGLGACIGHCPQDAITIEQREARQFDEQATKEHLALTKEIEQSGSFACPGMMATKLRESEQGPSSDSGDVSSQLTNWPVQLKLVSPDAPYFKDAHLLLVADCVPFAMGDFHSQFLRGRSIVVGCPKLDDARYYIDKLAEILRSNKLKSLTVLHMEVPCCHGLTRIATEALAKAGQKMIFDDVTVDLQGNVEKIEKIGTK
jgi:Pyruvate/2-oxoacid:ferredoxin oxidoreductase delta subunit